MSTNTPTPENLKDKAKLIRKFLKERSGIEVSHSHCLEMVSHLFNFKDWNTATAALKQKGNQNALPFYIKTVADLKKALESFEDSDTIDAMYEFKARDLLEELVAENPGPKDFITQEFSFVLRDPGDSDGIASLDLKLENEDITSFL